MKTERNREKDSKIDVRKEDDFVHNMWQIDKKSAEVVKDIICTYCGN